MGRKIIELKDRTIELNDCESCPFLEYDPHYSMSYDSGHDCKLLGERIANDCTISKYNDDMKKIEKQNVGLFKFEGVPPTNPFEFHKDCPLKNGG